MRLSSDVLYDNLKNSFKIEVFGPGIKKLILTRPLFYTGPQYMANSISVAHHTQFKASPRFEKNCLMICVGGMPSVEYLSGQCTCFVLKEQEDILDTFNEVQKVYNKYEDWQYRLQKNVDSKADLQEIADMAFSVFRNPVTIIDGSFHLRAYSGIINYMDELADYRPDENGNLKKEILVQHFQTGDKMELNKKEPFLEMNASYGVAHLCRNLFIQDLYVGNITIPFILDSIRDSDFELFRYFSKEVERAVVSHATALGGEEWLIKKILQNLLQEQPLDLAETVYLNDMKKEEYKYVCFVLRLGEKSNRSVPFKYLCNLFESTFPYSVAIEYNDSIAALVDTSRFQKSENQLPEMMRDFLHEMDLIAAKSCVFSDISLFRNYYRQACLAFDYARIVGNTGICHKFEDYKLLYMTTHCFGEFSVDIMRTPGFVRLLEHDADGQTNYVETLRIYLRNNMNITKTAESLFIHRSTFMERIKKIERILDMDLKSADNRLYLLMVLKAMDLNRIISDTGSAEDPFGELSEE